MISDATRLPATGDPAAMRDAKLKEVAKDLEVTFLSEMLKSAGVGKSRSEFGGGAGEDQFASFLRDEQARQIVASGGLGLSEILFNSLKEQENG